MRRVDLNKTLYDVTDEHPELTPVLAELGFAGAAIPQTRETHGESMTVVAGSEKLGIDLAAVQNRLRELGYDVRP